MVAGIFYTLLYIIIITLGRYIVTISEVGFKSKLDVFATSVLDVILTSLLDVVLDIIFRVYGTLQHQGKTL